MNCDAIIEDLQAFLDDELQDVRRSEISSHLQACKDCSLMISDLKDLSSLMKSCDVPTPTLPTGQQLLAKAGYKTVSSKQTNQFLEFLQSIYEFIFKNKAPIIATAGVLMVLVVAINLDFFNKNKVASLYQDQQKPTSSASRIESEVSRDNQIANKEALRTDELPKSESVQSNTAQPAKSPEALKEENKSSSLSAKSVPLAKSLDSGINAGVEGGVEGGVSGGVTGGVLGGVVGSTAPAAEPPPPPPVPVAAAEPAVSQAAPKKVADAKNTPKDDLENVDAAGFADKDLGAKKDKAKSDPMAGKAITPTEIADSKSKDERVPLNAKEVAKTNQSSASESKRAEEKGARALSLEANKPASVASRTTTARPGMAAGGMVSAPKVASKADVKQEDLRKVKDAQISIETKELKTSKEEISKLVKGQQGTISINQQNDKTVEIVILVPPTNFEASLAQIRKVGKITQERTTQRIVLAGDNKNEDSEQNSKKQTEEQDKLEKRRKQSSEWSVITLTLKVADTK